MDDLFTLNNVFFAIGVFSTAIYVIKIILYSFTGFGADGDISFDSMAETDISFNFISIQSILAFLMGFGWIGFSLLIQFEFDELFTIFLAFLAGLFFMFLSAYLMFIVKKMAKTVKIDLNELLNKTGRAYTSFSPKSKGQIEIDLNGRLSILDSYNASDDEINAFTEVIVDKVEGNNIYIKQKKGD